MANKDNISLNNNNINNPERKNKIVKVLAIIGGIVVAIFAVVIVIILVVSATSDKLICKSSEGNITIMYNKNGITGYAATNITYNLDQQKMVAKQIGVDEYMDEFTDWFERNTSGTCHKK